MQIFCESGENSVRLGTGRDSLFYDQLYSLVLAKLQWHGCIVVSKVLAIYVVHVLILNMFTMCLIHCTNDNKTNVLYYQYSAE